MTALSFGLLTALFSFSMPVLEGEGKFLRSDGIELHITCLTSECTVKGRVPGGSWDVVEEADGGRDNYRKLVAKYRELGFF